MSDRPFGETERHLDEVEPDARPTKWRLILALLICLLPVPIIVVGAKWLLFPDMSTLDYAVRSLIGGAGIGILWFAFFRRRLT